MSLDRSVIWLNARILQEESTRLRVEEMRMKLRGRNGPSLQADNVNRVSGGAVQPSAFV